MGHQDNQDDNRLPLEASSSDAGAPAEELASDNKSKEEGAGVWSDEDLADFESYTRRMHASFDEKKRRERRVLAESKPSFISLGSLLAEPMEETKWIVDELLPSGGFSIIAAKPKVGKSTLARQLALCVARGVPFLNRDTTQGVVLYVSLEDKKSEVKEHFTLLGATNDDNIEIYVGSAPKDAQKWLEGEVESRQPALIIIDTLFRFAPVSNINDYAEVTVALSPLLALARNYSAHLCALHHSRKGGGEGGDAMLGSTAIFGTVDTAISLKRSEYNRVIETHQRYGVDLEPTVIVFDPIAKSISLGGTKQEEDLLQIENAILDFLVTKGETTDEPTINTEVDGRTTFKRQALRNLVRDKQVVRTGGGKRGDPFLYSCSLVPNISTEQEKQDRETLKNDKSIDINSCSEDTANEVPETM